MYAYDTYDRAIVDARVAEFRDQTERRFASRATRCSHCATVVRTSSTMPVSWRWSRGWWSETAGSVKVTRPSGGLLA